MKLYHGTSKKCLFRILQEGITPRSINKKSNWIDMPSHPEMVYLSNAYPFWFSVQASANNGKIGAVIEIDTDMLDNRNFLPDEDFICQANAAYLKSQKGKKVENLTADVKSIRNNLYNYQQFWKDSLECLGSCCYSGTIPVAAITRYCVIEWDKRPELELNYTDYSVNIEHFRFLGQYYQEVLQWFWGDRELLPAGICESSTECLNTDIKALPTDMQNLFDSHRKQRDSRIQISKNRNGIKVIVLRNKK